MNCITYARVSTERQAERELSLPAQTNAMRDYAQRQGWSISKEFVEAGASGRTSDRPILKELLARCRKSPKVDVVLVHKIDRLACSVFDHATIRAVLKQKNIKLASVVENVDDTITGQLVENIMASIAEFYSANLGEETKKGMRMMVQKGGWPHRPPKGYRMQRTADGRPVAVKDPHVAPLVEQAFALYATAHYSFKHLARVLFAEGLMTDKGLRLSPGYLQQMLRNPFYAGRICWQGETHKGTHEALVSEEVFARVQETMCRRDRAVAGRDNKLYFWLRGVATCKRCGHKMTAERHRRWSYYRCSKTTIDRHQCDGEYANADRAHEAMERIYRAFRIPRTLRDLLIKSAEEQIARRVAASQVRIKSLSMRKTKLEAKQVLTAERYADGEIDPMVFKALSAKMRHEMSVLERELAEAGQSQEALLDKVRRTIETASSLWQLHSTLDERRQHQLLQTVFKDIVFDEGVIDSVVLKPPFDAIAKAADLDDGDPPTDGEPVASDLDLSRAVPAIYSILEHDISLLLRACGARVAAA